MISAALFLMGHTAAIAEAEEPACNAPVYMVVEGATLDRERMAEYGQAIAESAIYEKLGGYYITVPRPIAVFEGEVPENYVNLTVRFPCFANAKAFWNSDIYQNTIIKLRQDPSAGNYTVTVYAEMPLREDMVGKVEQGEFLADFADHNVPQTEQAAQDEGENP